MTRVKICGLRTPEDIRAVNRYRPDYAGMILSSGFRRSISKEQAKQLRSLLDEEIVLVGVFVDEPLEVIQEYVREGILDIIQLHGQETDEFIDAIHARMPGIPVWKAFAVIGEADLDAAEQSHADLVVLDSGKGTGMAFEWSLIADFENDYLLAGGLDADNVNTAIEFLHPYGVDVSSGVETNGVKDPEKIKALIEAVRTGKDRL